MKLSKSQKIKWGGIVLLVGGIVGTISLIITFPSETHSKTTAGVIAERAPYILVIVWCIACSIFGAFFAYVEMRSKKKA